MANIPSRDEWRRLYEVAMQVKELAPWQWMEETDVFGVQNPATGEIGFVSVMGALGEHLAVAVYRGAEGLYGFWNMQDTGPMTVAEQLLEIPQLQASFEDREELEAADRAVIKDLGLKFRGRQAWPLFRSYRPGFAPWFLEADEVRFLTLALEQVLDVAQRLKENNELLEPEDDTTYLVRTPQPAGDMLTWEDRQVQVPPPEPESVEVPMDIQVLEHLKSLPQSKHTLETDFFLFPATIRENKDERPYYPYMLMTVEARQGLVLGSDLMKVETSLIEMWASIPLQFVQQLASAELIPREVKVRSPLLLHMLQPLADELHFTLKESAHLPRLDEARSFLMQRF